ncbi:MAG: hypothetical protein ACLFQB_11330 [Chitinispirillaceae bacterium]
MHIRGKKFNRSIHVLLVVIIAIFCNCTENVTQQPNQPTLFYTLQLNALHPDSLHITLVANEIPGANGRFILPAHHFDNPVDSFSKSTVKNLVITDKTGEQLESNLTEEQVGPIKNMIFTVPSDARYPLTFQYSFDPLAIAEQSQLLPPMHLDNTALLMGSYLFIIPYISGDLAHLWRSPLNIELNASAPPSVNMHGIPSYSTYRNIYELLFTQMTAGAPEVTNGSGGGEKFVVLNLSQDRYDDSYTEQIMNRLPAILDETAARFGTFRLQNEPFTVSITGNSGALEGYNGFTVLPPTADNVQDIYMTFAHEAIHHFVGIRCGDYNDPWWKEGTTYYLGIVQSARQGFFAKDRVHHYLLGERDFSDPKYSHALSDEHVRSFHFKDRYYSLIYVKGMWVSMLMDERIRRATDNEIILDDVMGELCRKFDGSAFRRQDFLNLFNRYNADVSDVFADYVDTQDSIPRSVLEGAYEYLDSAGAFGKTDEAISFAASPTVLSEKF